MVLYKKELTDQFKSSQYYVLSAIFIFITGWMFFNALNFYLESIQKISQSQTSQSFFINNVVFNLFSNINFLLALFCPIFTMKSFSVEYQQGTIDLYDLSNTSSIKIVLNKFLAACTHVYVVILMTLIFPFVLSNLNLDETVFVITGYLGLFMSSAFYVSIGIFASSLGANSVIAAITSLSIVIFFILLNMVSSFIENYFLYNLVEQFSIQIHFSNFLKAHFGVHDILYFVFGTLFFLFLTQISLEWKKL